MKLKRVTEKTDWQHCCRWCHYFQNGNCYNKDVSENYKVDDLAVYEVAESGSLDEVISETIGSVRPLPFRELEYLLRGYNLSEKRIREFDKVFGECLDKYNQECKERLNEKVSILYQNHMEEAIQQEFNGVEISEPEDYCCKHWR